MVLSSLILTLVAGAGSGVSFHTQLQYTPALLTKGEDYDRDPSIEAVINPYDAYYFSHRVSAKVGLEAFGGWELRAIGGISQSIIPHAFHVASFDDGTYPRIPYTLWSSREVSVGGELGHAVRFRKGKGDIYIGLERVWTEVHGEGVFYLDTIVDTFPMFTHGRGLQAHIGMNISVITFGRFALGMDAVLMGGNIPQIPDSIPEGSVWRGAHGLPRWGFGVGLSLGYDSRKNLDYLPDLRLRPHLKDSSRLALKPAKRYFLPPWIIQGAASWGCGLVGGSLASLASLAWGGNGMGLGLNIFSLWTGDYPGQRISVAAWSYLGVPCGAMLGTALASRRVKPGGDWRCVALGALAGDVLSFSIAQAYLLIKGPPWRYGPYGAPPLDGGTFYGIVLPLCSTLPAIGAVVGYNLSVPKVESLEEDMGYRPSWTEHSRESFVSEWNSPPSSEPSMRLTLLRVSF